jgi:hypothetical protein
VNEQSAEVLGLPVAGDSVKIADLAKWIECRDASCAEYLAPALRQYLRTGQSVTDENSGEG